MKFIDVLADGEDVAQSNTQPISLQCFLRQEFNKWINTLWLRKIEAVLHRIGVRKWIGNDATIRCQFITGTRPWKEWRLDLILSYNNDLVLKPNLEELVCGFKSSSSARKPNARPCLVRLAATHANFSGGLKTDETGLHSFIFMRREGAPWENSVHSSCFSNNLKQVLKNKSFQSCSKNIKR